jgi:hypothetical protein
MIDVQAVMTVVRVTLGDTARTVLVIWQGKTTVGRHARCVMLGYRVIFKTSARKQSKVIRNRSSSVIHRVLVGVTVDCALCSMDHGPGCGQGSVLGRLLPVASLLDKGCKYVYNTGFLTQS